MMMRSMEEHQEAIVRDTAARFSVLVEYLTCLPEQWEKLEQRN